MSRVFRVSNHAAVRWSSRVAPGRTDAECRKQIDEFIRSGRLRSTPRSWMVDVKAPGGVLFLYSALHPGICGIVRSGVVTTFLTRGLLRDGYSRGSRPNRRPNGRGLRVERAIRGDREAREVVTAARYEHLGHLTSLGAATWGEVAA